MRCAYRIGGITEDRLARSDHVILHADGKGLLSPDETHFALIDAAQEALHIVPIAGVANSQLQGASSMVRRFSACGPPTTPNRKGSSERVDDSGDRLIAFCWWPDSSKLVVATAGGSLYILERYGGLNVESGRLSQSPDPPSLPSSLQILQGHLCILP